MFSTLTGFRPLKPVKHGLEGAFCLAATGRPPSARTPPVRERGYSADIMVDANGRVVLLEESMVLWPRWF